MVATRKTKKVVTKDQTKDQLVCVGPEHQPILAELTDKFGTRKNAVGKALELLQSQERSVTQPQPTAP